MSDSRRLFTKRSTFSSAIIKQFKLRNYDKMCTIKLFILFLVIILFMKYFVSVGSIIKLRSSVQ